MADEKKAEGTLTDLPKVETPKQSKKSKEKTKAPKLEVASRYQAFLMKRR